MPIFEVTAPDGKTYEVNAPEGATQEQAFDYVRQNHYGGNAPSKKSGKSRSAADIARDVGVTAIKGAVALPEAFVGLADIPTGGRVGKALEDVGIKFKETQDILSGQYSEQQQAANKKVQEADGFVDTTVTALQNPSTIATAIGESIPQMLGGAGIARMGIKAADKMGRKVAPWLAGAIGEGTMAAGSAAENMRQESEDGLLSGKQTVAALGSGAGTAVLGAAGGKLAQKFGFGDVDTILAKGGPDALAAGAAKKGFMRQVVEGGISEGVFEEMPQSIQETMWQNWANDKPLMEGTGNAAAMGMLAGMGMGMGGGGYNAAMSREVPAPVTPQVQPTQATPPVQPTTATPEQPTQQAPSPTPPAAPIVPPQPDPADALDAADLVDETRAPEEIIAEAEYLQTRQAELTPENGYGEMFDAERQDIADRLEGLQQEIQKPAAPSWTAAAQPTTMQAPSMDKPVNVVPVNHFGTPVVMGRPVSTIPSATIAQRRDEAATPEERQAIEQEMQRRGLPGSTDGETDQGGQVSPVAAQGVEGASADVPGSGSDSQAGVPGGMAGGSAGAGVHGSANGSLGPAGPASAPGVDFDVTGRTDEQLANLVKAGKPGWREAAIAEVARRKPATTGEQIAPQPEPLAQTQGQAQGAEGKTVEVTPPADAKSDQPSAETLADLGLYREYGDKHQYRMASKDGAVSGGWFTSNSKDGAIEMATKAHDNMPPDARLTREQRDAKADAEYDAESERRYGKLTTDELRAEVDRLNGEIASLQKAGKREFNGNGGRRTGAAVSNEGARGAGEEKMRLERLIKQREATEVSTFDQRFPNIAAAEKVIKDRKLKQVAVFKDGDQYRIGAKGASNKAAAKNLIARIKQLGGINTRYRSDVIGDKSGAPGLFSNNGKVLDDLATELKADGFDIDTDTVDGGVEILTDLIQRANMGETILNFEGQQEAAEKRANDEYRDNLKKEIEKLGGNPAKNASTKKLVDMLEGLRERLRADIEQKSIEQAAQLEAIIGKNMTDAEWDMLLDERNAEVFDYTQDIAAVAQLEQEREALNAAEYDYERSYSQATGNRPEKGPGENDPARGGESQTAPTEAGRGAEREAFDLTGETPEEVKAKEEAQAAKVKAEKEAADKAEAEAKKKRIDAEIASRQKASAENFVLGQDAEDAIAGQGDIFSQPALKKPFASTNTVFTEDAATAARERLKAKLGRMNAGLDPETMLDGITLAGYHIEKGARTFAAYAKAMIGDLGDAVKPYLKSWYAAVSMDPRASAFKGLDDLATVQSADIEAILKETGGTNEPNQRSSTDLERDRQDADTQDGMGAQSVRNDGRGNDGSGEQGIRQPDKTGAGQRGERIPGRETTTAGTEGDFSPFADPAGTEAGISGSGLDQRSGDLGFDGPTIEPAGTEATDSTAQGGIGLSEKRQAQVKAQGVKVVPGNRTNIAESLPFLLEGQKDDVAFAEKRFAKPDGYGVLFTNGTGTGKTYSGLGVIKRFERQGKSNILIVVPSDKISSDWVKAGQDLKMNITGLADTQDAGKGIVITTYANMGANNALVNRKWDLVVADESHYMMQAKDGGSTNALDNLRAITMHPRGQFERHSRLHAKEIARLKQLSDKITSNNRIMNLDDTMDQMRYALQDENAKMQAEADKLTVFLREKQEQVKAEVEAAQGIDRTRVVFLSATPFAYEKTVDYAEGYLFNYAPNDTRGGDNSGSPFDRFMMQHFGYSMKYNKLNEPGPEVNRGLMQRAFNSWLKSEKVLSVRMLDVEHDYDRKFILVDSAIGAELDRAMQWIWDRAYDQANPNKEGYSALQSKLSEKFDHLARRYLLESIKAKEAIPIIRAHLDMGRKVVVFHDFKKGGGFNPLRFGKGAGTTDDAKAYNAAIDAFNAEFANLIESPMWGAESPIDALSAAFPDALLFNGDVPAKKRRENATLFNDDNSGNNLIIGQSAAMKEGVSLHDTTGKHQRVLINLGLPTQPTTAIQQEGRIFRVGQASNAIFRYLNTGTNWERFAFATSVAQRASAAENLAVGEEARALMDAFIEGFEESDTYAPGHEGEGTGGKARDKAANQALTEWDRAMTLYLAQQKKTSRTKAQEGVDYFATPEPLGLKMVEWADIRDGDKALEPSAGHGAIARWLPDNISRTVIEPSGELASRLKMVMMGDGVRLLQEQFEQLDTAANKFDAVVLNPPFGTAGKTAIDHVAKAAKHLNNGGRIVALIPTGPAADKKFDKWFYEEEQKAVKPIDMLDYGIGPQEIYRGDTIKTNASWAPEATILRKDKVAQSYWVKVDGRAGETMVSKAAITAHARSGPRTESFRPAADLYLRADIKLPQVTFERAGTSVAARVVVIEKQTDKDAAAKIQQVSRDYSDSDDIKDFFSRIKESSIPARAMPATSPVAAPEPAASGKTKPETDGKKLETDAEEITYTTKKGKVLHGVIAKGITEAQAKEYDPYTWKKDGGFFIRMEHIKRPGEATVFSRANGKSAGIPVAQVQAIADRVSAANKNMPKVNVFASPNSDGVPGALRKFIADQKAANDVEGALHDGEIYLFASGLADEARAEQVLAEHEVTHYGLRGILGDDLKGTLQYIWANNNTVRKAATELAKKNGISTIEATEEVLADMPAKDLVGVKGWRRLVLKVRDWLGAHGFKALSDRLTEFLNGTMDAQAQADLIVADLVRRAREFVRNGPPMSGGMMGDAMLSRSAMESLSANMDRGLRAMQKAISEKATVSRAMYRDGLGWVDFVWGDEGKVKPSGKTKGGLGISHILEARMRKDGLTREQAESLAFEMVRVIAAGIETKRDTVGSVVRIGYEHDGKIVWLTGRSGGNAFAVTGYEIEPDAQPAGRATALPTQTAASRTRDGMGAGPVASGATVPSLDQATRRDTQISSGSPAGAESDSSITKLSRQGGKISGMTEDRGQSSGSTMLSRASQSPLPGVQQTPPIQPPSQQSANLQGGVAGNQSVFNTPEPSKIDDIIFKLQDKHIDLKRAIQGITDAGRQIADKWNTYMQEELFHGRSAKRVKDFADRELTPMLREMALRKVSIADLDKYLWARHAKEANALIEQRDPGVMVDDVTGQPKGSGMTDQEADDYFAGLSQDQRNQLDAIAKKVDDILTKTRDLYVSYGLENRDTVQGWADMFQHYVPLMREDHDGGMGIGQGFSIKGREAKHRTGSTRAVADVLANIAAQRERAIVRGEKNRVAVSLAGLVKLNPAPDFWTLDKIPQERVLNEKTGQVETREVPNYRSRDNVIIAKIKDSNGNVKERAIVLNERDERAVRLAKSMKNIDIPMLEGWLGSAAAVTRYFSSINTQYNPVFGVINLIRDVGAGALNLSSTALKGKEAIVTNPKRIAAMYAAIYAQQRTERAQDKAKWIKGALDMAGADRAGLTQLFEDFTEQGGQTGFRDMFKNSNDRADAMQMVMDPTSWTESKWGKFFKADGKLKVPLLTVQKGATPVFQWLSDYNLAMENAVRLSAYKEALDSGMSKPQAASLAKNLTVNFNRKGSWGAQAGALYAFFNAATQGTARIGETLTRRDHVTGKYSVSGIGKKIIGGGVMLGVMQAVALAMAGFDDDEPPEFIRERNIVIPLMNGKYVSIPMPLGFHVIPNIGRIATETLMGRRGSVVDGVIDLMGITFEAFNPIGSAGWSMQTVAPTILDPMAAIIENKDWTGKPIAKEKFSNTDPTPGFDMAKDNASTIATGIAYAINLATGGSEFTSGKISPTPDQLDYLWGQVTGGVGRETNKIYQSVESMFTGEELPPHKIPLAGRLYGDTQAKSSINSKFYQNVIDMKRHEAEYLGRREKGDAEGAREYLADNPEAKLFRAVGAYESKIQQLRSAKRKAVERGINPDRVKAIEQRTSELMDKFNQQVESAQQ